jgi:AcrR family transcriptional regulator
MQRGESTAECLEADDILMPPRHCRPGTATSCQVRVGGRSARVVSMLRTTLEVLGQEGYVGLRIDDIAERAGVNKTTIYRHWPTRVDLGHCRADQPFDAAHSRRDRKARMRSPADVFDGDDTAIRKSIGCAAKSASVIGAPARIVIERARRGALPKRVDVELLPS